MRKKLKTTHPDFEKVAKLFALAEELEISINFGPTTDVCVGDNHYALEDVEGIGIHIQSLIPPPTEWILLK